jgi:DNA polymerase-3 subunit gamma/tau
VQVPPFAAKHRVYIIDEVHMLTREAFNALLKTLEEPPPHVFFIFATTELHKVPVTILSRCQQFEFQRISMQDLTGRLEGIAAKEEVVIEKAALKLIAFQADGSMRDAESLLDQVISYSAGEVTMKEVAEIIGVVDRELLFSLSAAIIDADAPRVLSLVDRLIEAGYDLNQFMLEFIEHFRNLLVFKTSGASGALITAGEEEMKVLAEQSGRLGEVDLIRLSNLLIRAEGEVRYASSRRFALELNLLKMIQAGRLIPIEELLKQAPAGSPSEEDRGAGPRGAGTPETPPPDPGKKQGSSGGEEREPKLAVTSLTPISRMTEEEEEQMRPPSDDREATDADQILTALKKRKISLYSMIKEAGNLFSLVDETLTVGFSPKSKAYKEHVEKNENMQIILKAAEDILGRKVKVRITFHTPEGDDVEEMISKPKEEFEQERMLKRAMEEPVVRAFMDAFHSEILDVEKL